MKLTWNLHTPTRADIRSQNSKYVTASTESGPKGIEQSRAIYCYSRMAFAHGFDDDKEVWNDTMRNARGLVIDYDGTVLARGLPKFFNLGENEHSQWTAEHDELDLYLFEKFNGFCAHVWYDHGNERWRCTTKAGSEHEFEGYGIDLMRRRLMFGFPEEMDKSTTYIAEGVHESDPHTIHYEPGLYLIGAIRDSVMTIDTDTFPGFVMKMRSLDDALTMQAKSEKEGYVMYLVRDGIVKDVMKLKSPYYIDTRKVKRMAAALTNDDALFQQFIYDSESVMIKFNHEYPERVLGDFYDDWYAANAGMLTAITVDLNMLHYTFSNHVKLGDVLSRKEFVESLELFDKREKSAILCLLDKNYTKYMNVLNKSFVDSLRKQYGAQ